MTSLNHLSSATARNSPQQPATVALAETISNDLVRSGLSSADIGRAWNDTMRRSGDLLRLFDPCDLGLLITRIALALGLKDKNELQRLLRFRRLPPFKLLRNWYYVILRDFPAPRLR